MVCIQSLSDLDHCKIWRVFIINRKVYNNANESRVIYFTIYNKWHRCEPYYLLVQKDGIQGACSCVCVENRIMLQ